MKDFIYYTPTEVVFGRGAEEHVADLVHQVREGLLIARAGPLDEVSVHLTVRFAVVVVTAVYP